jgi:hypothetical protein
VALRGTKTAEYLRIDAIAIGVLAAARACDELEEAAEDYELHEAALRAVTDNQRDEIFACLKAAYGDEYRLYSRIWHTRSPRGEKDSEGDEFEVTGRNTSALEYVTNGFRRGF